MVRCPICSHNAESYETLFRHLTHHKKADIISAFLRHLENVEAKLSQLEADVLSLKLKKKLMETFEEEKHG